MKVTAWRAALRIARRDALRAKGRSALVLAMIALPVFGVAGADVVFRSAELEPQEKIVRLMGQSDALVSSYAQGMTVTQGPNHREESNAEGPRQGQQPTAEQQRSLDTDPGQLVKELLPPGTVLVRTPHGPRTTAASKEGRLGTETGEADLTDPVWHGALNVVRGAAPREDREIAVSQAFLDQSGLRLGDTTTLRGLDRQFTITAVVERPGELGAVELIARPGAVVEPLNKATGQKDGQSRFDGGDWLVKLPAGAVLDWPKVKELNKYGFAATSRSVLLNPPARADVPYYVEQDAHGYDRQQIDATALAVVATVAGMALLEIVLLAGPAFAVGARRSRRQLGLLAAGGGDRSHVRAVVLGGGMVLGLAGAVVGVVLAAGAVAAGRPWLEQLAGRRFGHFDLQPLDLLGVAALGLVTGLLAAIVPAVQASRQDVVEALTGRGSVKPANRKIALLGLLMLAGGAALALLGAASGIGGRSTTVLGGSVLAELGMVLCTPLLVGLFGRLGRHLPLSPRLALRDAVRHRGRTAPAVAAVMAAVAGSVAVGIYTTSQDEQSRREYTATAPSGAVQLGLGWGPTVDRAQLPQLRAAVESAVPDLGPRGDLYQINYKDDCRTVMNCGRIEVSIPKERRCPAMDRDVEQPVTNQHDYEQLMSDPRCQAQRNGGFNYLRETTAGDAVALRNLTGLHDEAVEAALTSGKAVVFDPIFLKDGKVTLDLVEPQADNGKPTGPSVTPPKRVVHPVTVDAVLAHTATPGTAAFLTPDTATRLGLGTVPDGSVWLPAAVPSGNAEQRATGALEKLAGDIQFHVERGYVSRGDLVSLGLTGFAAIVALGAAAIATGLAAADSQRDLATLAAVGADGGIRRRLSGFQCGVIAAMGAVLGTICGFVPPVALRKLQQATESASAPPGAKVAEVVIAYPWLNIGITLVVLPLVATLLAALCTRGRIMLARRTA